MALLEGAGTWLLRNFVEVLRYPATSSQRIFWGYLLSSALLALFVFLRQPERPRGFRAFLRFCFPRAVWSDPSAWLDVRYFFVHQIFRVWIYAGFRLGVGLAVFRWLSVQLDRVLDAPAPQPITWLDRGCVLVVGMLAVDFVSFGVHYLQHHVPVLWEFHKVHHSVRVMHPLSNYREHWVDNFGYALGRGLVEGVAVCVVFFALGHRGVPTIEVLSVNALTFLFNVAGYNLRHSHVWLAWPRWLAPWFGSPAYHQIHHSCLPEHRNRNLAFLFPFWDRLTGAQVLPPSRPIPLQLGIGDGSEHEYDSVLRLYWLPFRNLATTLRSRVLPTG